MINREGRIMINDKGKRMDDSKLEALKKKKNRRT